MNGFQIGAAFNGLSQGLQLGTNIRKAMDESEVRNVMAEGLDTAKQARADDIAANTQVGSKANADDTMTVPTYDDTRGNSYADADAQKKGAEKNAPSMDELYMKNVVPKIKEAYIAQGNMAAADKWDEWTQDKNTRTALGHLSKATIAGRMGDFGAYADNMIKTYNTPGYYEDGIHAEGYDLIKDKDGNTTGVNLKLKNKETGQEFTQAVNGTDDMLNLGIAALDPRKGFELSMARQTARDASAAKIAEKGMDAQYGMLRDTNKEVVKAKAQSALQDQKAGDKEAEVRLTKQLEGENKQKELETRATAGLLYKKGASPQEAHRMLVQSMAGKFVDYAGKPTMSPGEMSAIATQMVEETYGKGALANPMANGLPGTQTTQAPGVAPAARPAAAPGKGVVRLDTKTGQVLPM
jgi:hypothetical protein